MIIKKGFTLIELMIVVAIVSILISIAIPTYQNYIIRARVTDGMNLVQGAKLAVEETAITMHSLPQNQAQTGYISPRGNENVSSITIADSTAEITITYTNIAGGGTIVLTPTLEANGDVTWTCNKGTLADTYRPPICRQ